MRLAGGKVGTLGVRWSGCNSCALGLYVGSEQLESERHVLDHLPLRPDE
jgi:hypothetical protein